MRRAKRLELGLKATVRAVKLASSPYSCVLCSGLSCAWPVKAESGRSGVGVCGLL